MTAFRKNKPLLIKYKSGVFANYLSDIKVVKLLGRVLNLVLVAMSAAVRAQLGSHRLVCARQRFVELLTPKARLSWELPPCLPVPHYLPVLVFSRLASISRLARLSFRA